MGFSSKSQYRAGGSSSHWIFLLSHLCIADVLKPQRGWCCRQSDLARLEDQPPSTTAIPTNGRTDPSIHYLNTQRAGELDPAPWLFQSF